MFRLLSLVFLVGIGFFIGLSQSQNLLANVPALQSVVVQSDSASLVRCASDVKTAGWKLFRSDALAFQFSYPASFSVSEKNDTITLTNSGETITMQKIRDTLKNQVDASMEQGGWKVADRKLYALTTPYYTNDDGTLSSTYLFVRDFPQEGVDGRYVMVKALITMTSADPSFARAKEAGIVDLESILTVPEQILSTFRFLAFDEV